jgi:uncharacterized protein (DUF1800 family)
VVEHFVTTRPAPSYITRLADSFRRSKYDMKTLMRAVFTSPEFTADANYRALLKSPTEFMVHGARALGAGGLAKLTASAGSGMGQSLFDPPDVSGWPNNAAWISSNTVVERVNFVTSALAQVKGSLPSATDAARTHLDGVLSPQTAGLLNQAPDEKTRWFITLASPEFQLK